MKFKYCPQCSKKLTSKIIGDEGQIPFCSECQRPYFDIFPTCVIVAVINEFNEIALLKQNYVSKDNWVLVAGFIKQGETLEESAIREVEEETGQISDKIEYINSYYYEKKEMLFAGFLCLVKKREFNNSPEVDKVEWFDIDEAVQYLRQGSIAQQLLISVKERLNQIIAMKKGE